MTSYAERLVQAAAEQLEGHIPTLLTDEIARAVVRAVLDAQVDDLGKWKQQIDEMPVLKSEDRVVRGAQKLGIGLVRLKLNAAADEIEVTP